MGLAPDARLSINREVDLRALPLTPVDFFLYSRVEMLASAKPPTVAEVVAASGQPQSVAETSLHKLIELGALRLQPDGAEPSQRSAVRPSDSSTDLRERARSRRRSMLEAQMRAARSSTAPPVARASASKTTPEPDDDQLPAARVAEAPSESTTGLRSILDEVEPVATTDPRLEHGTTVDLDRQRRLLALRDRLRHVGHFELLGLDPTDDVKQIRRAYHIVSRDFHPDSFYGKNLGSFGEILDALFRRARTSYEFLLDPARRKPLVEAHQVQLRAEQERRERDAASQAEAQARATRAEQDAAQQARTERAARDHQRQNKARDRALDKRRAQAEQHAEQARREQEAGRHGTAATLFRLAHEHDPKNPIYEACWREALATARKQRAEQSITQAAQARAAGRGHEAAKLLADAADADPSLRNLSEAAAAMADFDGARARELAMHALEAMNQAVAHGTKLDDRVAAGVHHACAKAFLAAGQHATAREQAERALALAPTEKTRTLLNSIKLA